MTRSTPAGHLQSRFQSDRDDVFESEGAGSRLGKTYSRGVGSGRLGRAFCCFEQRYSRLVQVRPPWNDFVTNALDGRRAGRAVVVGHGVLERGVAIEGRIRLEAELGRGAGAGGRGNRRAVTIQGSLRGARQRGDSMGNHGVVGVAAADAGVERGGRGGAGQQGVGHAVGNRWLVGDGHA